MVSQTWRVAFITLTLLLHVDITHGAYTAYSYPNWLLDSHSCNINAFRAATGWVCDPHALLTIEGKGHWAHVWTNIGDRT
jgi:hypothetical protein